MTQEILEKLADVVVKGKIKEAKPLAEQALASGITPQTIIFDGLSKGMAVVGRKYENKQYFLPQVLMSAQTMYQALDVVLPKLQVNKASATGKVVIGVVEGDVHDIGKNIVKAIMTGAGMIILDMGRDVPIKSFYEKGRSEHANVIAESTLMTPTLAGMEEMEKMLREGGEKGKIKTIIGGGATSKEFAAQIGADGWAYDALEAVRVVEGLVKK